MHVLVYYLNETFATVRWCHTLFVPMAVCPKCCTNLYQELEKVPSLEIASTTPMNSLRIFHPFQAILSQSKHFTPQTFQTCRPKRFNRRSVAHNSLETFKGMNKQQYLASDFFLFIEFCLYLCKLSYY